MPRTTEAEPRRRGQDQAEPRDGISSDRDGIGRIDHLRRRVLKSIPLAGVAAFGSQAAAAEPRFPETIPLPDGFRPEGIVTGRGHEFFVGSRASGAVYRGDLRTGEGEVLVESIADRVAIGLSFDRRSDRLFVAGDGTGKAFVYDAKTGETAAVYTLTDPGSFVNDVVVTSNAAYFTDSFRSYLYEVPLGPGGRLPDRNAVEEISLGEDFRSVSGFNTNGIDVTPSEDYLIIVNSSTGLLYRVDPVSGDASEIDLGGETLVNGDGILLDGKTLYVVRNRNNVIAVVRLSPGASAGEVVREITDPGFAVPTTIAEFGSALYAVNARLGVAEPEDAEYTVVRVPK